MPSTTLTIDEVYGGGGNSLSTYKNDYIVLHNLTSMAINLSGYSIQYASATGTNWQVNSLTGVIAAGGYFLIQEKAGTGGTANLPMADYTGGVTNGSAVIDLSGTMGKVALVQSTTPLAVANPAGMAGVIDLLGYGTANGYEGAAAGALTNTTSAVRASDGNTDNDNNSTDFTTNLTPSPTSHVPYNSASPPHAAGAPTADTTPPTVSSIALGAVSPTNATSLTYTVTFSEPVTGVDVSDFTIVTSGVTGASVTSVAAVSTSVYTVTVNDGTGDGTVKLSLVDNDSIKDTAGNALGGTGTTGAADGSYASGPAYTVDHTTPTLASSTPTSGATGVAAAANITLTFSEVVKAGAGAIVLHDVAGVQPDRTIPVTDASQVTVSGQTVTINPTNDLAGSTTYQVSVAPGAVLDSAGNGYAGGTADTFTTAAAAPPPPVTSGVLFSANFDSYTAAGLSPGAAVAGTLDSNVWMAVGFSDPQPGYGGTVGAGDYGQGLIQPSDDPGTAGLYSGVTGHGGAGDHALLIQPTGAEFDVNGYVELRVKNTTGQAVTGLSTSFDWVYHNNEARADNLTLAYSTDGVNYTAVPAANLTTPGAAATSPVPFTYVNETLTLDTGAVVAPDAYLYLRFQHPNSSGGGSRDEVGIDNLSVSYGAVSHTPILSAGNVTAAEGNSGTTPFVFTVQRAGDLTAATTVHYATADGTATAGSDYTAVSGDLTFAPGDTSRTVTVNVNGDLVQEANETFTLVLSGATNASLPTTPITGTITNDDMTVLGIADIQGASQTSPFVNSTVTTQGIVTALKTGSGGGFYIQDSSTTGPAGASHGLFIFTAATPTGVVVGDAVTVTGLVTEYQAGNNNLSTTELNNPTFNVTSHNNAVTPVVIGVGGLTPPTDTIAAGTPYNPATSGADFYESLEGQLVTVHNARAVDATYSGSTWVVADGTPMTGANARGGITVTATDFNPERIQVYSTGLNASMGEQLGDITGVLTYFSSNNGTDPNIGGEYELIPTAAIMPPGGQSVTAAPTLARPTTSLNGDASHVSIGAYNVENLGPTQPVTVASQAAVDARFAQLGRDIAQNLRAPDILGLEEIQDADGQGAGTDLSGAATLNKLIAAISAAGGPAYQYVEIAPTTANTNGGAPNGNIRTAYLYNPARVGYVAGSAQLIADPDPANGDAFANSRKPLVAQFTFNGQTITAIDIHDYARSGSQELFGATQPPVNSGDQRRVDQTAAVNAYVNQLLAADPNAKVTVQGDFNGFQFEPTLTQLTHGGGGQLNQLSDLLPAAERYSTTFEGDAQEIDHLLVSDALRPGAAFDIVHLNTGQPAAAQASDHDPIVSLLTVAAPVANAAPVFTSGGVASTPENVAATTAVYTARATDADGDTLTYVLSGADAAKFAIDAGTGAVTFRAAPDFEQPASAAGTNTYAIAVTARDGAGGHAVDQAVSITVTDSNDNAPAINSAASASVASGAPAGTVVYTATATDADTVGTLSYVLGGTDAARFAIDASTGAVSLRASPSYTAPDDAGADHVYDITVQASDGVNLSAARAVQVAVTAPAAVNAAAPVFTSGANASTPENVSTSTAVYTARATDADGDRVSYALAGGADDGKFNLDAATGALTFKGSPDFEQPGSAAGTNTYAVQVRASDGLASHDVVQAVAVAVTDVAEAQPPVASAPPAAPAGQTTTVDASGAATVRGDVRDDGVAQFSASATVEYTGSISGTGSVTKAGPGVLTFSGVSTYTGATTVTAGVLVVDGSIASSPVTVGAGAVLGGHGTTGPIVVQTGGILSPGNSPGQISTGAVTLAAGATLSEEVGGFAAGQFDVVHVTGAVSLGGATLSTALFGGFTPPVGGSAPLVIIDNDGVDAVTGTFAGLAEGASFTLGGQTVRISYVGGTGNDVTLQFLAAAAPPPSTSPPSVTPSQALGLAVQGANLLRAGAGDAAASDPTSPIYVQAQAQAAIVAQLDAGRIGAADAQSALYHLVDGTTSVAEIAYAFFTGRTPTAAGLNYLVHSPANPTDLNDAYYARFSTENRYINFASNLATGAGAGAAQFQAAYGSLSLSDTVAKAYAAVFGIAPAAGKVDAILDAQVSNGLGGTETRAQYFADITGGSAAAQKAAAIGFLLADSVKEGFGAYQQADLHFLADLAHGTAAFNVDLLAAYGQAPSLVGQSALDLTLGG